MGGSPSGSDLDCKTSSQSLTYGEDAPTLLNAEYDLKHGLTRDTKRHVCSRLPLQFQGLVRSFASHTPT